MEVGNTASFTKWAQLQKGWRLLWPSRDLQTCTEELLQPLSQVVVETQDKMVTRKHLKS